MTGQEPPGSLGDLRELLDAYLDHYRDVVLRKLGGLPEEELRHSRVPSGWTPLWLLVYLTWVERRWLVWGRKIISGVPAAQRAALGGRFATPAEAPTLGWILFHLLQEYARHAGHLHSSRDLTDGTVGE